VAASKPARLQRSAAIGKMAPYSFNREARMKHAHTARPAKDKAARPAAAPAASAEAAAETATAGTASSDADARGEFVRQAAYYYYEARGRVGGHELDDWLKAEAQFEQLGRAQASDDSH
jgi:hypothetical protein